MTMTMLIDRLPFDLFKRVKVHKSLGALGINFQFDCTSPLGVNENFAPKYDSEVLILADGKPVVSGYVEKIKTSYDPKSHAITIFGRSRTGDVIDSTIGVNTAFTDVTTNIELIIATVLSENNFDGIVSVSVDSEIELETYDGNQVQAKTGEGMAEFFIRYAKQKRLILIDDGEGNIVITRNRGEDFVLTKYKLFNSIRLSGQNIKSASLEIDRSQRFFKYVCHNQGSTSDANLKGIKNALEKIPGGELVEVIEASEFVDSNNIIYDLSVRETRIKTFIPEKATSPEELQNRAEWERSLDQGRGVTYVCTVFGHTVPGDLGPWDYNKLIMVEDELISGGQREMLIKDVTLEYDVKSGSTTTIVCVDADAFSKEFFLESTKKKEGQDFLKMSPVFDKMVEDEDRRREIQEKEEAARLKNIETN